MIPAALRNAVAKKVGKNYSSNKNGLVIYLNISTFGFQRKEVVADLYAATELAKDKFNEVWVAWDGTHHLLWRDGKASREVSQAPLDLKAYG